MEEEGGVKAPVTRLRRRLSVEQPESPSTPATPTKKRNTRLAAKPQLELIDEHAITNSPSTRTTRKSTSRDLTEPEENILTPARRSSRVKSNTSLNLEAEEKPVTPARRSSRVKSNTSIVSDTIQNVDSQSARAKRAAARLTSQFGSDTELSLTPARARRTRKTSSSSADKEGTPNVSEVVATPGKTKRTRKGSTSSLDNTPAGTSQASPADIPPKLIPEIIIEEPESKLNKSISETDNIDDNNDSPMRKSPRIMAKKSYDSMNKETSEKASQEKGSPNTLVQTKENIGQDSKAIESPHEISIATSNLIRDLDIKLNKKISDKNKSMSDLEDNKTKRSRTKSWTTLTSPIPDNNFFSDNESNKKKLKKHGKLSIDKGLSNTGSGDGQYGHQETTSREQESDTLETTLNKSKKNRKSKESSFTAVNINLDQSKTEIPNSLDISSESNKENIIHVVPISKNSSVVDILLEKAPTEIKTTVFIQDDSDSNTGSIGKSNVFKTNESDDQCVPVADPDKQTESPKSDENNIFAVNTERGNNDSVEPMDIDETMPENVSLTVFSEEGKQSRKTSLCLTQEPHKSKRKSSLIPTDSQISENVNDSVPDENKETHKSNKEFSMSQGGYNKETLPKSKRKSLLSQSIPEDKLKRNSCSENTEVSQTNDNETKARKSSLSKPPEIDSSNQTPTKSKRKLSHSILPELERSENENKSTLVLSEIKDVSTTPSFASKSPRDVKETSVNISQSAKNGPMNKNLTLHYLTSTPVQQKNIDKITMQMNTSVITPTNMSKKDIKDTSNTSEAEEIGFRKKKSKYLSESVCHESASKNAKAKKNFSTNVNSENDSSDDGSEASNEEESSQNLSNLLDSEAEDAGEDYESGDSQDEEEREYERENEILEGGETLTSEDEASNDSDYEKDSFIVSSAEEDCELLSGSEYDLDMSNNELGMDTKSKKKYDERKMKEQKKASKEMYEARHGLNKSEEGKSKKSCRSRLDSSLLKSDDDNLPPKKSKRMRLESSTLESSQVKSDTGEPSNKNTSTFLDNEEIGYKKKKSKRLSESVCNESAINEQEITISNPDGNKQDPLSINIKVEPKTPQKDLEISTIQINEEIEQINLDENTSMVKPNNTIDPLQATILAEDNETGNESLSENEEIADNYDSMLKELNKKWQKPIKSVDISLNLNKRTKKSKVPIVDELNLTETKIFKTSKDNGRQAKEKSVKRVFKKLAEDDEASEDSIDLKLLFSDESNHTDKSDERIDNNRDSDEILIPLKKSEAKTDIHKSLEAESDDNADVFNFFIDTKGDLGEKEANGVGDSDSNEAPVEVLYANHKNRRSKQYSETLEETEPKTPHSEKKKKKKLSESQIMPNSEPETVTIKTPKSEKNKKEELETQEINKSEALEPKISTSGKKKKKYISETSAHQIDNSPTSEQKTNKSTESHDDILLTLAAKTPVSEKKKTGSQNDVLQREVPKPETNEKEVPKKPRSGKKKKQYISETSAHQIDNSSASEKKTNKSTESHDDILKTLGAITPVSEKKKTGSQNAVLQREVPKSETNEKEVPKKTISGKKARKTSDSIINKEKVDIGEIAEVTCAQKRKREKSIKSDIDQNTSQKAELTPKKKKLKISSSAEDNMVEKVNPGKELEIDQKTLKKSKNVEQETEVKLTRKRKHRDTDDKIIRDTAFNKVHVPRLPSSILAQLGDKIQQLPERKKAKVVSTTNFVVEETLRRKNKPSDFLEESVNLNHDDDEEAIRIKTMLKKPKVLPSLQTVSISDSGFTTKFTVNILPNKMEFIAKNDTPNFKNDYLYNKKMKKLRTYNLYKKQRNMKLTKY